MAWVRRHLIEGALRSEGAPSYLPCPVYARHVVYQIVQPFRADLAPWRFRAAISSVVAVALMLPSCGRGPTSPQPTSPQPTVVGLELSAPTEIAPGASVALTASAVKFDGSVENVTSQAEWGSSNSRMVTVSAGGLATAGTIRGEVEIVARYQGRSASARLFVLPADTFRLTGRITENALGVRDVRVTVVAGVGEGLVSRTLESGAYSLYGVRGRVRLQARREGYLDAIEEIEVSAHSTHGFELLPEQPMPNLAGAYTLTVTYGGCRTAVGALPDAAKHRIYTANITQDRRSLSVVLSGADFLIADGHGDRFGGYVDASGRVNFFIGSVELSYYYDLRCDRCDLVERLTANTALVIGGSVAATFTASEISGILFGVFFVADSATLPLTRFPVQCTGVHDFVMRRK
jgi:hypothetical protein